MFGGGHLPMMGTGYPYSGAAGGGIYPSYGGYGYTPGIAGSMPQQQMGGPTAAAAQQEGDSKANGPPKEMHPQINLTTIIRFLTESAAVFEGLRMVLQVIKSWGSEVLGFGQTGPLAGVRAYIIRFLRRILEWFVPRLRVAREGRELQQAWEGKPAEGGRGTSWLAYLLGGIIKEDRKPKKTQSGGESDVEGLLKLYKRKQREMYVKKHGKGNEGGSSSESQSGSEGTLPVVNSEWTAYDWWRWSSCYFGNQCITVMIEEDVDLSMKVIVVGNGQVGKTSMITRFAKGVFTQEYKKTLAVDFLEKRMWIESAGEELTFLLWDTAGQEEYDAITRGYYKGASAAIIAFSTVDRASFEAVESWYKKVVDECGAITMLLVQNKVDLLEQAVITPQEAESLARRLHVPLYRTCVSANLNIDNAFLALGESFLANGGARRGHQSVRDMSEYSKTGTHNRLAASGTGAGFDSASVDTHHTSSAGIGNPPRGELTRSLAMQRCSAS
ncbi:Ras- protein Rab-23 [Perkinsus chesapeaki]|uniref:Ras- protein Rab-23 n=1 Tax=Perkinsus chesapeaki TaxID=330153 RepID=A0A7J6M0H3_PERCH|nr:Ras- protein Rab-23 [Perkinsus chesapeaki]